MKVDRETIAALCEAAAAPDEDVRSKAVGTIFGAIAEPLGDAFEPANVPLYDRIFAQIIDDCRKRAGAERVDELLRRFNIHTEQNLLERKTRIASNRLRVSSARSAVKKVLVTSRITLGADVAVSSVMVQFLGAAFPQAMITFIAPQGTRELFADTPRFQTIAAHYPRHGSLTDRLLSWVDLVKVVDAELKGLSAGEYVVVDPDSRLTQLGLLPLMDDDSSYFFFDSRSYRKAGAERLGHLAMHWCNDVFGTEHAAYPFVRLAPEKTNLGKACSQILRAGGRKGVVSLNFGFGANEKKQLGSEFEVQLVLQTLNRGAGVILDKGIGQERDRANLVLARLRAAGRKVVELNAARMASGSVPDFPLEVDAIAWEGDAAGFAGLIASTDLYIGYDSAFQHIAAALGVTVIDIFAHTDNNRFIDRWTPYSKASVRVVKVAAGDRDSAIREIETSIRDLCSKH